MKYAMDVKVNLKPIFSNLVHTDWWEGPCRVGPMEEGTPEFERRVGKEQFKIWYQELQNNLDLTRCNLMDPVYMEFDESFVMRDSEFDKLMPENHQVDLYLITYRVPGIEPYKQRGLIRQIHTDRQKLCRSRLAMQLLSVSDLRH